MELVLPKRRFTFLRRILRRYMPGLYGWMLESATIRRMFRLIKGEQRLTIGDDLKQKFTAIYETHYWVDDQSRSGGGSNLYATEKIRQAIPALFEKYGIRSILDIPCGDFVWFKEMKLNLDSYVGGDIVPPLIATVADKYSSPTRCFRVMDLTRDPLPDCDLILVRDCFIHLSFHSIFEALNNIMRSNISYLLTTHHGEVAVNSDLGTHVCRPINLYASPFKFPPAIELIEDYAKGLEPHHLGLWRVDDLRKAAHLREASAFSGAETTNRVRAKSE